MRCIDSECYAGICSDWTFSIGSERCAGTLPYYVDKSGITLSICGLRWMLITTKSTQKRSGSVWRFSFVRRAGQEGSVSEDAVCSTVSWSASEELVIYLSLWFTHWVESDCRSPLLLCNASSAAVVKITLRQLPSALACLHCCALCVCVCVCFAIVFSCSDEREIDHPPQEMCWHQRKLSSLPWHITYTPSVIRLFLQPSYHHSELWKVSERVPIQADKPQCSGLWSSMCVCLLLLPCSYTVAKPSPLSPLLSPFDFYSSASSSYPSLVFLFLFLAYLFPPLPPHSLIVT